MDYEPEDGLRDSHVVVTGGGTGLGLGMALAFCRAGARVTIVGRREQVLREACRAAGPGCGWIVGDVTDQDALADLHRRIADRGPVEVLVNNAGNHLKKPLLETKTEDLRAVLDTHVTGAVALSREVARGMIERGRGHILFIASMTSFIGMPQVVAYSAAKSAITGVVRSLAVELGSAGVRVNAIAPGWIETPLLRQALEGDPARKRRILERTPLGRFGEPSDVGEAAVYLSSRAARFITGVVLPVDGGALIGF